jgi:2-phospho-L-lactate guanylyltransferase (CobY/MobA/RfbA family)
MLALLGQVLDAAAGARLVTAIAVATSEAVTLPSGVLRLSDGGLAWNEGLVHALGPLATDPAGVSFLAADLPAVTSRDIDALIEACPPHGLAIARARDGGTNGLALRPANVIVPSFGSPGSAAVHATLAAAVEARAVMVDRPGLALDLDTPDDLTAALATGGDRPWRAALGLSR